MDREAVAKELVALARELVGMEFPTKEALDKYLKDHPDADRSNHKVVETKEAPKKEAPKKPEQLSREDEDAIADVVRDQLMGTKRFTTKEVMVKAMKSYMKQGRDKEMTDEQIGGVWDSMVKDGYLKKMKGGYGWNNEGKFDKED